jgi:CRISPR/Cas system-associated protein Cas5 (RAMP superfamily)
MAALRRSKTLAPPSLVNPLASTLWGQIIYVVASGYGSKGEDAEKRAFDVLLQAADTLGDDEGMTSSRGF